MYKKIKYTHIPELEECAFHFDHVKIYWNEQITLHEQKSWELSYIITGSGTRIIGDKIEPFSRNEVILIPPNIPHCWLFHELDADSDGKIENITLSFTEHFLDNCARTFPEMKSYINTIRNYEQAISFKGDNLVSLQKLLVAMTNQSKIEQISSFIQILYLMACSEDVNHVGKRIVEDKWTIRMKRIHLYIMNNYQNTITLDEMAKLVDMNKAAFCIFFKRMTGKSFISFLNEYRIEISCHMLLKTGLTVAEICYLSGFKDIPYFNRTFRRMKNCTPNDYRKMNQCG